MIVEYVDKETPVGGRYSILVYPASEAFLQAVQENTRKYYWIGKITTKAGAEIRPGFVQEEAANGSLHILYACHGRALTGESPEHAQVVGSV